MVEKETPSHWVIRKDDGQEVKVSKKDKVKVLLRAVILGKAGSTGLDFQKGARVGILWDIGFTGADELQFMGRFFRTGQPHPVQVYRFNFPTLLPLEMKIAGQVRTIMALRGETGKAIRWLHEGAETHDRDEEIPAAA
ncbi:MAG: hypothetical protein QW815_08100 [Nitrososphaerota archaeon]